MASVYRAHHFLLKSKHAIKVLHPELAQHKSIRQRFLDEGRIQACIRHPHITPITDVVVERSVAGLVMPLMPGEDLKTRLEREGAQPLTKVLRWADQVLAALSLIHEQRIVHRDLKPANLYLERLHGGTDDVRLLDFGIAKIEDSGRTRVGVGTMGSMAYMSPEQYREASNVDARSDLFAIGVIVYEALAGHSPFQGDSEVDTQLNIVRGEFPPLRSVRPALPTALDTILTKTLATDPNKRFASAAQLARALSAVNTAPSVAPAAVAPMPPKATTHPPRPTPPTTHPSPTAHATPTPRPRATTHHRPQPIMLGSQRLQMVTVPTGGFRRDNRYTVEITKPLLVGSVPITTGMWTALMGKAPGERRDPRLPVTHISWFDAVAFCNALSESMKRPRAYAIGSGAIPTVRWQPHSPGFRLLSEAEWEHAGRAGQDMAYAGSQNPLDVGWFADNTPSTTAIRPDHRRRRQQATGQPQPVSRRAANPWGLYDMSGNVWEWVWDHGAPFPAHDQLNPTGPAQGATRVCRGGSWKNRAAEAPLSARLGAEPTSTADDRGFRVCCFADAP